MLQNSNTDSSRNQKFKIKNSKTEPKNLVQLRFFSKTGLYQIYKEKSNFFSCSRNWNCELNLFLWAKNGPKNSTRMRKNIWKFFFYFIFWENKKKIKLLSKASLNLSFKGVLRQKQKTTSFPDSDIYTRYYP